MPGGTRLIFHGVRGSTPCAGAQYARYGGNTSCVSLEAEDHPPVIFDMGTGMRPCGQYLANAPRNGANGAFHGTVLLTHLHWDHIQGLPFFAPVSRRDATLDVYGPAQEEGALADVFRGVMRPPYFPITPNELHGTVRFYGAGTDDFPVGGAKVRSRWVRHTSPTIGFRVELDGVAVAYVSDHGPGCSDDPDDYVPPDVLDLCDGVDVLIHDSQHTCEEFESKRHFGHSTIDYAVHVAVESGAHQLVLFHHCPTHGDDAVDRMLVQAGEIAERARGNLRVIAASEGLTLEVTNALAL